MKASMTSSYSARDVTVAGHNAIGQSNRCELMRFDSLFNLT